MYLQCSRCCLNSSCESIYIRFVREAEIFSRWIRIAPKAAHGEGLAGPRQHSRHLPCWESHECIGTYVMYAQVPGLRIQRTKSYVPDLAFSRQRRRHRRSIRDNTYVTVLSILAVTVTGSPAPALRPPRRLSNPRVSFANQGSFPGVSNSVVVVAAVVVAAVIMRFSTSRGVSEKRGRKNTRNSACNAN